MSAVFKKLNLKDQREIAVVSAPASFEPEIAALRGVAVRRSIPSGPPIHATEVAGSRSAVAKKSADGRCASIKDRMQLGETSEEDLAIYKRSCQ